MSVRIGLTFDCVNAVTLGEFWKLALGYEDMPPPDPYTSIEEWMAAIGEQDSTPEDGTWLRDPAGVGPSLSILRGCPSPKWPRTACTSTSGCPVTSALSDART